MLRQKSLYYDKVKEDVKNSDPNLKKKFFILPNIINHVIHQYIGA